MCVGLRRVAICPDLLPGGDVVHFESKSCAISFCNQLKICRCHSTMYVCASLDFMITTPNRSRNLPWTFLPLSLLPKFSTCTRNSLGLCIHSHSWPPPHTQLCYRTLPSTRTGARLRPDLLLGQSDFAIQRVGVLLRWFEGVSGTSGS